MENRRKHKDFNQIAKSIVDKVTSETSTNITKEINTGDIVGRAGGLKGGKARAERLTPVRRKEIAQQAAAKRWGN